MLPPTNEEKIKENVYQKSIIYKIVPKDINIDYCYVGSSHRFTERKATHKSDCYNEVSPRYGLPMYDFIRNHGGWGAFCIIVVEHYACDTKRELEKREQHWKEAYGSSIGKRAYIDKDNYYLDNKEEIDMKHRQYYQEHKEDILTKLKTNYANDEHKRQQKKEYYLKNRERILQNNKKYYYDVVKQGCCSKLYDVALTEN